MPEIQPGQSLKDIQAQHPFFVGIDSDGCVFDTMEIKHKECFIPNIIKYWNLQAVSKYAREAAEFVNLYSKWRGVNRWPALIKALDLLRERPEVLARHTNIPELPDVRAFIADGGALSNDMLQKRIDQTKSAELAQALVWSKAVNTSIADMVHGVPPFPMVRESLEALRRQADIIVVSQTPVEALVREWQEHNIDNLVRVIAGQEQGTKSEHIRFASEGRYADEHKLMIGDAPGDLKAARDNHALFFPINPGQEEKSWQRFYQEGMQCFLSGTFAGSYEQGLITEFERLLPDTPPWVKAG
ncbi:MAG: HAD hydrolase-like protein [Chloroflexi bacterium]|nr:HAD hydrolase-like protein [Chloroflexota bacterium]